MSGPTQHQRVQQLGRYELIKRIAVGGMGVIYLARSRGAAGFEKTVIIKKILEHLAEEEEFVTKFLDEGRIVVNLSHGNIVPVFDMDAADGEYFIAMEYVPGRDLRDVIKRLGERGESLPVELAVYVAIEVAKGLDYAHRRTGADGQSLGIVHRDISPSNILISRDGEVKIIDFGIARAASRASRTVSGRIQGKICYMSPEQASGKAVGPPSDVFSLGVVLYEMLTGERLFQGESDLQSLDLVRQCEFKPPSRLNPAVPPELDAILERVLSADLQTRYASADHFQVELLEWLYTRGKATTGQQLADFMAEIFPDGFERESLRRARDASTGEGNAPGARRPLNLDDALNAELEKLGELETLDSSRAAAGFHTRTASAPLDSGNRAGSDESKKSPETQKPGAPGNPGQSSDPDGLIVAAAQSSDRSIAEPIGEPIAVPDGQREKGIKTPENAEISPKTPENRDFEPLQGAKHRVAARERGDGNEHDRAEAAAESSERTPAASALTPPDNVDATGMELAAATGQEQRGFKRWLLVALVLGVLGGGAATLYALVFAGDNQSEQSRTRPDRPRRAVPNPRQVWVTALPRDATISVNDGEKTAVGQVQITIAPDEQILLEAEHPECEPRRQVVSWRAAQNGVQLELDCTSTSGALGDAKLAEDAEEPGLDDESDTHASAETRGDDLGAAGQDAGADQAGQPPESAASADAAATEKPVENTPPVVENAAPKFVRTTFLSRPPGAKIELDGKVADGPQRLAVGQSVELLASLNGYKTFKETIEVDQRLGRVYWVELEKIAMGCVLIRPNAGQQVEVRIDGDSRGETTGARFDLPAGAHTVELTWGDGSSSRYDIDVAPSADCTGPLGFSPGTNDERPGG